jgi:hypothetical protein
MPITDTEKAFGFQFRQLKDGHTVDIVARHVKTSRMPNSSEMLKQLSMGRRVDRVEQIRHKWAVLLDRQHVGVIRLNMAGDPSTGRMSYRGKTVVQAGLEIIESEMKRRFGQTNKPGYSP